MFTVSCSDADFTVVILTLDNAQKFVKILKLKRKLNLIFTNKCNEILRRYRDNSWKSRYSQNFYLTTSSLRVQHSDKKNLPVYFRNHPPFILTDKKSSHGDSSMLIFSCLKGGSTSGEDEESAGEIIGIETKVCII
jgi:hypothetical protein